MLWRGGQRRWSRACALARAVVVAPGAIAVARASARHHARPPSAPLVRPRHARAFRPALGDWEGQFGALHASFQLVRRGGGYAISDLVYQQPESCPANTDAPSSSFVSYATAPPPYVDVADDGSFPRGARTPLGALLSSQLATLRAAYSLHGCRGSLRIGLVPSPRARRRVEDGRWRAVAADGSESTFVVRDGGRVAYGLALAPVTATCPAGVAPGSFSGSVGLFVEPDGSATQMLTGSGLSMTVSLSFRSATRASGSYAVSATDCTSRTLTFAARRLGRS